MRAGCHPTAIVAPEARVGEGVTVGPYALVEAGVELGPGCVVEAFAVLQGGTVLGPDNRVGTGAVLGGEPQDLKYAGEPTRLVVGRGNRIGRHAVLHRGTPAGGGVTVVGDGCVIEDGAHVGHDCRVGDRVHLGAGAALGGHVVVGEGAFIGPLVGVHQFTHVGRLARIEGQSAVTRDVPPFVVAAGNPAEVVGFNREGLERWGTAAEAVEAVEMALQTLYRSGMRLEVAVHRIAAELGQFQEVRELLQFLEQRQRGLMR